MFGIDTRKAGLRFYRATKLAANAWETAFGSVARNTAMLLAIMAVRDGVSLPFVAYLARSLEAESFGRYSVATSYVAIFMAIFDLGAGKLLTREISRNRDEAQTLISAFLSPKPFALLALLPIVALFAAVMSYDDVESILLYESALVGFLMAVAISARAVFHAFQRMEYDGIGLLSERIVSFAGAVIAVKAGFGVIGVLGALTAGSFLDVLLSWGLVRVRFIPRISRSNVTTIQKHVRQGFPVFVTAVMSTLYLRTNTIIVERFLGATGAGWFSAAFQLFLLPLYLPQMLSLSLFPVFSEMYSSSPGKLQTVWRRVVPVMAVFGIVITVTGWFASEIIIPLIFSKAFLPSIPILQILLLALPFTFASSTMVQVLVASDRQHIVARVNLVITIAALTLSLWLVPRFQLKGAAAITVLAEASLLVAYYAALPNANENSENLR